MKRFSCYWAAGAWDQAWRVDRGKMWSLSHIFINPDRESTPWCKCPVGSRQRDLTSTRRDLLDLTLKNYKQERLRCKLPVDAQLRPCSQKEFVMKRRLVDRMEQMDKMYNENLICVSKNVEKLANSISQGFAMLNSLIGQQTQHHYSPHLPSLNMAILFISVCYLIYPHLPLTAFITPLTLIIHWSMTDHE